MLFNIIFVCKSRVVKKNNNFEGKLLKNNDDHKVDRFTTKLSGLSRLGLDLQHIMKTLFLNRKTSMSSIGKTIVHLKIPDRFSHMIPYSN